MESFQAYDNVDGSKTQMEIIGGSEAANNPASRKALMNDIESLLNEYRPNTNVQLEQAAEKEPRYDTHSPEMNILRTKKRRLLQSQLVSIRGYIDWGGHRL